MQIEVDMAKKPTVQSGYILFAIRSLSIHYTYREGSIYREGSKSRDNLTPIKFILSLQLVFTKRGKKIMARDEINKDNNILRTPQYMQSKKKKKCTVPLLLAHYTQL
jgi:hypothetical protein